MHQQLNNKIQVAIQTEFPDVDIYYTLNGTEPTPASLKYTEPFRLSKTAEVKQGPS
ncbi:chitobiase/beta-hexosaminidase C-terminal domain-containing protein [Flavihumibacter sp. CACIAM 22H1]|uniref:chitobiase/beta-hexosaminidase C-terminal domain-containing protein n=1 Tax=Flavihumibacter sp. CACIAM 22H1 TaxID=1812911 RepID=UPI000AAA004E